MTGRAYATSAEIAAKLGAFPGHKPNAERMLRVIRNHKRAADGLADGYEKLCGRADAARPCLARQGRRRLGGPVGGRARLLGRRARARRAARLSQRAGLGRRPDRHDRPRDGLRHHRHRARLRAGEVQEARRRRLFQDHQPRRARGAARARLRRGEDRRDRRLCRRPRLARPVARRQHRRAARQGLHRRRASPRSRPRWPARSTSSSSSTNGRSAPTSSPAR